MAEAKATKKEFLEFIWEREIVTARDLMNQFGYSYSYACKRLSLLKNQGLVLDMGNTPSTYRGQWCLTTKGHEKLHYLQQREKERNAVIEQEKMPEREEMIRLKKRVEELEELVEVLTGPGGLKGKVAKLLKEYERLAAAYAQAPKLGIKPEQLDFRDLTSRLEKLIKYSELLPAEERGELLKTLGL
jgi:hypothetical protein